MKKIMILGLVSITTGLVSCNASSSKLNNDVGETSVVATASDSVITCNGRLVMGHEVCSFAPDGDTLVYWVVDRSGELEKHYEAALPKDAKPYTPVSVRLKVKMLGYSSEGFAADYDGVVEVQKIIE